MLDHTCLKVSCQTKTDKTKTDKMSFCLPHASAPKRTRQQRIRSMQGFELIQSYCGIAQMKQQRHVQKNKQHVDDYRKSSKDQEMADVGDVMSMSTPTFLISVKSVKHDNVSTTTCNQSLQARPAAASAVERPSSHRKEISPRSRNAFRIVHRRCGQSYT